ncbi:hypothetical protein, partial [Streptosporangium sandarakinum]
DRGQPPRAYRGVGLVVQHGVHGRQRPAAVVRGCAQAADLRAQVDDLRTQRERLYAQLTATARRAADPADPDRAEEPSP